MSATNRGGKREAVDNYPTPAWCTRRLLEAAALQYGNAWPLMRYGATVLEPAVGDGAIVRAVHEKNATAQWLVNDVRGGLPGIKGPQIVARTSTDFTQWEAGVIGAQLAITNPPFSLAEEFVQQMLTLAPWVAVLVRQGFVGHGRAEWMRGNMPDTFELPERPSFASKAKCRDCDYEALVPHGSAFECPHYSNHVGRVAKATDAADYCWLVWTPERNRRAGLRMILPSTTLEERKELPQ